MKKGFEITLNLIAVIGLYIIIQSALCSLYTCLLPKIQIPPLIVSISLIGLVINCIYMSFQKVSWKKSIGLLCFAIILLGLWVFADAMQ